uniref:NADH dehydrogenase subunit 6 n=1 Tax=Caenorhabditis briggsae TaxID=6238 RepID=D3KBP3_CAEBR|nr:NADH dehydrogenase subunit 6 [Caenorhabditis briggsae]ACB06232.1 NADH dehydrogenase subunit 6 [Caenorhabditis briggsae]ACB06268.1 NADH dehydrogenase subunit 6 [Caenorhabditis briggsae]ACB06280.1 NADH dehydrogenase subunit 6 [Caenorhabditis briggsae]ACB06292.1 NADH dehydrogenase subunit 6 [Caenorhabditis briggsae]
MIKLFFVLAIFSSIISYMNIDPMKSSFFLIFSLLFSMPIISMSMHTWFSYFICLLFLSGIFVILVYFSSLSKINVVKSYMSLFLLLISIIYFSPVSMEYTNYLGLSGFYYSIYWFIFSFILICLLFFMNFSSYFLNFSGALRKV